MSASDDGWTVEPHDTIAELEPDYRPHTFTVSQHLSPHVAAQLRQLAAIDTMADLDLSDD